MIELKARIDNIKRHFKIDDKNIVSLAENISYDTTKYLLVIGNKEHKLPKKEGDFLSYFLRNRAKVISTDELMVNVWSYDTSPTSATIRTYVKNLRRLLGEDCISTIRGVGYLFN